MKKRCCKCGIWKPISDFYRNKTTRDGYQFQCKDCFKDFYKENKEQLKERQKDYQKNHRDYYRKRSRERYEKNKDYHNAWVKEYFKTPNGKAALGRARHKRRAYMKNTEAALTAEEWEYILKKQNNKCNLCGKRFTIKNPPEQDHIIPVKHNGVYSSDNIQALCQSCNSSKGAKLDKQFIQIWTLV